MVAGGTFAPGNPTGTLTIGADLNFDAANLQFALGSGSASAAVAGNLSLAGSLSISNAPAFGAGTYTLFTYSGALTMGNLTVVSAPAGFDYIINTNKAGQINLTVTLPQFNAINTGTDGLVMSGSGGPADGNYCVLGSTNVALPLNLWTRIATNQFDSSGNFNFTNAASPDSPQEFYRLELP